MWYAGEMALYRSRSSLPRSGNNLTEMEGIGAFNHTYRYMFPSIWKTNKFSPHGIAFSVFGND
jgi:hypothetical protein